MVKSPVLRIGETILALSMLGLGLFIAIETWLMPPIAAQQIVGPGLFPALVAISLVAVGLQLFGEAFLFRRENEGFPELDWNAAFIVAAAFAAQVVLLERLGWVLSGTILFTVSAAAFGSRDYARTVLIGLALTAVTYFVFDYGLALDLPTGSYVESLIEMFGGGA